jgi:hypothetical protein
MDVTEFKNAIKMDGNAESIRKEEGREAWGRYVVRQIKESREDLTEHVFEKLLKWVEKRSCESALFLGL